MLIRLILISCKTPVMRNVYWSLTGPKMELGNDLNKKSMCMICMEDVPVKHYFGFIHAVSFAPAAGDKPPAHSFCNSCAAKISDKCPVCRQDGKCVRLYFPF